MVMTASMLVSACAGQSTPSMMNTNLPRLSEETVLLQAPAQAVNDAYLYKVSADYDRYGQGQMQLTLIYDPAAPSYNKLKAFKDMDNFKKSLKKYNVHDVKGEVIAMKDTDPVLMVSYDAVMAHAPAGCRNMPGFDDGMSTRHIGEYRFGCTTDTMLARQIYRPSDLRGNTSQEAGDGRRATATAEYYRAITQSEAESDLRVYTRDNIQQ